MIIKMILCPVDDSKSAQFALKFAKDMATRHEAYIDVIHVYDSTPEMTAAFKVEQQKNIEKNLQINESSIKYVEGAIPDVIIDMSKDYDLIVMGLRGAHHSSRYYGSNAAQILQNSACPVFLIPPREYTTNFRKIAFATDFKHFDEEEPFETLRDLADEHDADLHLLHISSTGTLDGDEGSHAIELHEIFEDINHAFFVVEESDIIKGINQHLNDHQPQVLAIMPRKTTKLAHTLSQAIIDHANTAIIFSFHS